MTTPTPATANPAAATSTTTNSTHAQPPHPPRADITTTTDKKKKKPTINTNETTLDENSTAKKYAKNLRGRYATDITLTNMNDDGYAPTATLTLDNDTTLTVEANKGYDGYANGQHHITRTYKHGNHTTHIMNTHVEYTHNENNIRDG